MQKYIFKILSLRFCVRLKFNADAIKFLQSKKSRSDFQSVTIKVSRCCCSTIKVLEYTKIG